MSTSASAITRVRLAKHTLLGQVGAAAALLLLIQIAGPLFMDWQDVRFGLVLVWFASAASLTWSLTDAVPAYLSARARWRYAEAGPGVQFALGKYLLRQQRFLAGLGWVATAAVVAAGVYVLTFWSYGDWLRPWQTEVRWIWIAVTLAVPVYVLAMAGTLNEARSLRREVAEQVKLSGVRENSDADLDRAAAAERAPAVSVTGPMGFRAGGYDWLVSDFYKNAAVFGMSGSGKTVCVLNALLDGLIGATAAGGQPCAGLVLDPKGDFRDKIARVCRRHGRGRDLVVIDPYTPGKSAHFNPLDSDDDPLEVAGRFQGVLETLSERANEDTYWLDSCRKFIQHLLPIVRAAKSDAPPDLIDIYECASDDERILSLLDQIPAAQADTDKALARAYGFMTSEWLPMDLKPKGTIRSFLTNMVSPFLQAPYDHLFAGRSTKSMGDILDEGKILYVYMPIADREIMARVVSTFVKLAFYREVLKRIDKKRPSFFLCDEFQAFFTTGAGRGDAEAFERTRQSNHANIVAFQNLPALLRQTPREDPVMNLLGNCATKIFLRNTDQKTNEYASTLFGEQIETLVGSGHTVGGLRDKPGARSLSTSAQYTKRVRPDVFTDLAVPSREDAVNGADAMVHLGARARVTTGRQRWKVHPLTEA